MATSEFQRRERQPAARCPDPLDGIGGQVGKAVGEQLTGGRLGQRRQRHLPACASGDEAFCDVPQRLLTQRPMRDRDQHGFAHRAAREVVQ